MKISVVTVCFNAADSIEKTIRSVCSQTYNNIEYIIVDGLSKDKTMEIVKKHDDKISKIISEKDRGIFDAMNKGLSMCTGDVINFLNADDSFLNENILEDIAETFKEDDSRVIVYGKSRLVNAPPGESARYKEKKYQIKSIDDFKHHTICHQAVFAKRDVFAKVGGFNCRYKYAADYDWLIRAFKSNFSGVFFLEKEVVLYQFGGLSYQHNSTKMNDFAWIQLRHLFSLSQAWFYFRYVLIRGLKKWVLNEPW